MTFSKGSLAALEQEPLPLHGEGAVRVECTVANMAQEDLQNLIFPEDVSGLIEGMKISSMKNLRPDGWLIRYTHRTVSVIEHAQMDDTYLEPAACDQLNDEPPL